MLHRPELSNSDSAAWAIRSQLWLERNAVVPARLATRQHNMKPLILCGHGASLRVENGALVIRDGFTHYPQARAEHRLFPGDRANPSRIVVLDGSGSLTFAVLSWLFDQGIALIRIRWTGDVEVIAGGRGYSGDLAKVDWQRRTKADDAARLSFASDLIRRKLAGSLETLAAYVLPSKRRDVAERVHCEGIEKLSGSAFTVVNDIRGLEGMCARQYFRAWEGMTLRWTGKRAVPPQWQEYSSRSSFALDGMKPCNRAASHPINAMLNYGYAVKLAKLQVEAITEGYDPTIGIFHHGKKGNVAYAFDLIEPERPKVDAAVLKFIGENTFAVADFMLNRDGICRLSPQLARAVVALIEP